MRNIWSDKGTTEVDMFGADWANLLGAETISTSEWAVISGGVSTSAPTITGTETSVKLSGGTVGIGKVTNTITTNGGRTLVEEFVFPIIDKSAV